MVGDGPQDLGGATGEARGQEVLAQGLDLLVHDGDADIGVGFHVRVGKALDVLECTLGLAFGGPEGEVGRRGDWSDSPGDHRQGCGHSRSLESVGHR